MATLRLSVPVTGRTHHRLSSVKVWLGLTGVRLVSVGVLWCLMSRVGVSVGLWR